MRGRLRRWIPFISQRGLTLVEMLVGMALMSIAAIGMTTLVGVAVKSKVIVASRSGNAETGRQTLDWMAERLRNAGLNLKPSEQGLLRCKDMVVALDATLLPTAGAVYVSGEILNDDTEAGDEDVATMGYYLGADPQTGRIVVIEYKAPCSGAAPTTSPLSDPKITVTALTFSYFRADGTQLTAVDLANAVQIRTIRIIRVSLTLQSSQGSSGTQTLTLSRDVMLRNPDPSTNDWKNPNETN